MATRARSRVTEKQQVYVDEIMVGKSKVQAAKAAGSLQPQHFENSDLVKREIALARTKLTDLTQIKRVDVIDGIMDGIAMARMMSDPANVIKGWMEVGKILGHYAPEVKTVNLNVNQQRLKAKFESLTDEELLAIAESQVVDVDAKELND